MVEIPLPDGPDKIKSIVFSPGEGNDSTTVDLSNLPADKRLEELQIEDTDQTDTGNDNVTVKNVSLTGRGRLKVGQEAGEDATVIEGCDATNLNVDGGAGDDVTIRNCNVNKRIKIDGRQRERDDRGHLLSGPPDQGRGSPGHRPALAQDGHRAHDRQEGELQRQQRRQRGGVRRQRDRQRSRPSSATATT